MCRIAAPGSRTSACRHGQVDKHRSSAVSLEQRSIKLLFCLQEWPRADTQGLRTGQVSVVFYSVSRYERRGFLAETPRPQGCVWAAVPGACCSSLGVTDSCTGVVVETSLSLSSGSTGIQQQCVRLGSTGWNGVRLFCRKKIIGKHMESNF